MRNIILITGPIADGKTTLIRHLQGVLADRGVPQVLDSISDGSYLLDSIRWDHQYNEGRRHWHDGQDAPVAHEHAGDFTNRYDFVATGREIQTYMFRQLFQHLASVRDTSTKVLAELAAGSGDFSPGDPLRANDYSYNRIVHGLQSGEFNGQWIDHLQMVIHPGSEFSDRVAWNTYRLLHPPSEDDIRAGRASWGVPERVVWNTRHDDFSVFQAFLESQGIPRSHIVTIENHGGPEFLESAARALESQGVVHPEMGNKSKEGK